MIPSASPPPGGVASWGEARARPEDNTARQPAPRPPPAPVPAPPPGSGPVPADPTPDRLNGVAARVRAHRTDQEESVRVAAHSAVAVRRPAVAARSSVAADDAVDRVRGQPITARRTRHLDGDGRPGVAASAPGDGRGTAAARTPGSARDGRAHVPLNRAVGRGHDDNPCGRSAPAAPTPAAPRVRWAPSPAPPPA